MAKWYRCVLILLSVGNLGRFSAAISRPSSVVLENNEFKNLLVAIEDSVQDSASLIQTIKDTFTKASAFMYAATNHRAVFRDVTILVPPSWSNPSNTYAKATSQILSNADVIFTNPVPSAAAPAFSSGAATDSGVSVETKSRVRREEAPGPLAPFSVDEVSLLPSRPAMTKMYAGCGHQGVRVTLTTDILTDRRLMSKLGPPEKVLVHEWSQFRWGVFDEYALEGEPQFYFSPKTGKLEGVRCTELIQGIIRRVNPATGAPEYCRSVDPNTGLYPEGCNFLPYPAGPYVSGVEASIMDHLSIRPISKFCDDQDNNSTRHNYDAPSRHNRLCGHRSTWDVIMRSQDFANGANPSRVGVDTAPVFTVVQAHATSRVLLALDTSTSMAEDHKMTRMRQAVATFVQEGVTPSTDVGLATFSDTLQMKRAPQALNSTQVRQEFADDLPDSESGATDITLALTSAAKLFQEPKTSPVPHTTPPKAADSSGAPSPPHHARRSHVMPSQTSRNSHVIFVTDGQETSGTNVTSALPLLRDSGVMVSFVILGETPQPALELVAKNTGGRIYYDRNDHSSVAATDALFDVLDSSSVNSQTSSVQILSRAKAVYPGHAMEGQVFVDKDLGNKTTFIIAYDATLPGVKVTSPSGRVYNHLYPEYSLDHRLRMVKILIPFRAEVGRWTYKISSPDSYQKVSLLVLSSPSSSSTPPVKLSGLLMPKRHALHATIHVFAEATRGQRAVSGLRVKAHVSTPDGASEEVELFDNGAGADIVEDDGVYSRFYSKLRVPGVYTVQVTASGRDEDTRATRADSTLHSHSFLQRSASAGHVVVWPGGDNPGKTHAPAGTNDTEAPVRISDLRVVKTSGKNRTVVLSWRASGDDTDRDSASSYEVYIAPTAKDLMIGTSYVSNLTQNDIIHGNLVAPKPFGAREFFMVRIPDTLPFANRNSLVFTVVAVDEAGNRGEHSNYVTVGLGQVPDVTDHRYWKAGQFEAASGQLDAPPDQQMVIAGVLGTVSALFVLVIVVSVLVYFLTQRPSVRERAESRKYLTSDLEKGKKTNVFAMS